jgi:HlyD family secretion protein
VDRVQDESIHLGCPDFEDAVIGPETAEAERLGTLSLVPGMPTEICLVTEKQTALAYMAKPVMDQVERALREE